MDEQGVTALLGLILLQNDGEIRIPMEALEKGLPSGHGVRVISDEATDELVLSIQKWEVEVNDD